MISMYADYEYYSKEYKGTLINEDEENLLDEASDDIDDMVFGRIRGKGFDNLTEYQQKLIKKAVCAHAEFSKRYGAFINSPVSSYSIGKTSMSFNGEKMNGIDTSSSVIKLLNRTGLTCLVP